MEGQIDTEVERRIPILVAEDSEDSRFLLQAYCQDTPYELTFAEDGETAVSAYQAGRYDIVVMDVQMPVVDGLTATRRIRDLETGRGNKRTPILALTAHVQPQDVVQAHEAGCDLHLAKPISRKRFLRALEQWKPPAGTAEQMPMQLGLEGRALSFVIARQRELPVLQDLWERDAFVEIRRLANRLKLSGVNYGFGEISRLGAVMEQAALSRDSAGLAQNLQALASYLDAASQQARKSQD